MDLNPLLFLSAYAVIIFFASLIGGKLSDLGAMTHTRIQVVMSLVAGFILGISIFHLLPHSLERIPGHHAGETAMIWMMVGIVVMIFMLHVFHFHQHDFSDEASDHHHHHHHAHHGNSKTHSGSLLSVALGLGLHTVTEGVALGTSIRIALLDNELAVLPGMAVFFAILLHKPLDAYSILSLMKSDGHSRRSRRAANVGFALLCPIVAFASFWGVGAFAWEAGTMIGYILAFAAGAFLCIALSDLLPEIHFHSHDRGKLIASLLLGIGLSYALFFIESAASHGMEMLEGH